MDDLDLAIFRETMSMGVTLIGSLNPRTSAEVIARKLRMDPSTVRRRLRRWEEDGFLENVSVFPNFRLFGAELYAGGIAVADVRDKPRVFADLALIDGIAAVMDHVGEWIGVSFVLDHPSITDRREKALARIEGVSAVQPLFEVAFVGPTRTPTHLDWRLLATLRRAPRATFSELADDLGVSTSTVHTRYASLVNAKVLFSVPHLDFKRFDGGVLLRVILTSEDRSKRTAALRALAETFAEPLALGTPTGLAHSGVDVADVLLRIEAVAQMEDVDSLLRRAAGVLDVEILFPRRFYMDDTWADDRVARHLDPQPVSESRMGRRESEKGPYTRAS